MGLENWADIAPKKELLLSEESARAEMGKLLSHYEVDLADIVPEQEAAVNAIFSRLLTAFKEGKIELKEDMETGLSVIQHIKTKNGKDKLTYRELKGSDRTRLAYAGNDATKRMQAMAGLLSGHGEDIIGKLSAGDLRTAEALGGYFLVLA